MEKICKYSIGDLFTNDFVIVELIHLLDLKTIMELKLLSKSIKQAVENENYALFQKLREFLKLPTTFETSDIACKKNIEDVFRRVLEAINAPATNANPFAYYTDGGVDTNSNYYFLHNVWKKTGICYCTVAHENVHIQSIISQKIDMPAADNQPMKFLESKKNKLRLRIPYENYLSSSEDKFHILKQFQIHLKSGGYNAYIKSFAVFYSETEVENIKFTIMTKRFTKLKASQDISILKLKVLNKEVDKKNGIKIYEFDVSDPKEIER
jgi:hypothetical protein